MRAIKIFKYTNPSRSATVNEEQGVEGMQEGLLQMMGKQVDGAGIYLTPIHLGLLFPKSPALL